MNKTMDQTEIYTNFKKLVNMTGSELEKRLITGESGIILSKIGDMTIRDCDCLR